MSFLTKAILLSLLVALLYSQTTSDQAHYNLNGQSYTFIYGSGASSTNTGQARSDSSSSVYTADATYVPPATGPAPAVINCPINQVYDNVLC